MCNVTNTTVVAAIHGAWRNTLKHKPLPNCIDVYKYNCRNECAVTTYVCVQCEVVHMEIC